MGVLGHRQAILSAIRSLPSRDDASQSSLGWAVESQQSGGESPVLKAIQHRQKLLRELEKAEGHAAALQRWRAICSLLLTEFSGGKETKCILPMGQCK